MSSSEEIKQRIESAVSKCEYCPVWRLAFEGIPGADGGQLPASLPKDRQGICFPCQERIRHYCAVRDLLMLSEIKALLAGTHEADTLRTPVRAVEMADVLQMHQAAHPPVTKGVQRRRRNRRKVIRRDAHDNALEAQPPSIITGPDKVMQTKEQREALDAINSKKHPALIIAEERAEIAR